MIPYDTGALKLLQEGSVALAEVERNGIRIDERYLKSAMYRTERRISRLRSRISDDEVVREWKRKYGRKFNLNSTTQLGDVLFNVIGYKAPALTATGRPKTDESTLAGLRIPFVRRYLQIKKLEKALGTYLKGIQREAVDGYLHPVFNLHLAGTYRSSSSAPNFQNIPIRNERVGNLVRRAFVARPRCRLVEVDYSGIEVRIAACYHRDPAMLSYLEDESKDMHRDSAADCFLLPKKEVGKKIRYCGKNMFVFPQFYGDWYIDCARSLWKAIDEFELKTESGVPLRKHLEGNGITTLGDLNPKERPCKGTFEHHIQKVEQQFWRKRFPQYARWRKEWVRRYQRRGWLKTKTGFICQGFMKRNEIINYPVQGSAFHCLLWSLIQIVRRELPRRGMKALVVGQIHDSIVADVPENEVDEYLAVVGHVMTKRLPRRWRWILVPLEIDAEASPIGGSWAEKEGYPIGTGPSN